MSSCIDQSFGLQPKDTQYSNLNVNGIAALNKAVMCQLDAVKASISSLPDVCTNLGDLTLGAGNNSTTCLTPGNSGDILQIANGIPTWTTPPSSVCTSLGDLTIGAGNNSTTCLSPGLSGELLQIVGGIPTWAPPVLGYGTFLVNNNPLPGGNTVWANLPSAGTWVGPASGPVFTAQNGVAQNVSIASPTSLSVSVSGVWKIDFEGTALTGATGANWTQAFGVSINGVLPPVGVLTQMLAAFDTSSAAGNTYHVSGEVYLNLNAGDTIELIAAMLQGTANVVPVTIRARTGKIGLSLISAA